MSITHAWDYDAVGPNSCPYLGLACKSGTCADAFVLLLFKGCPDVAANASPNSGFHVTVNGESGIGDGTSASAPLSAGLVCALNSEIEFFLSILVSS